MLSNNISISQLTNAQTAQDTQDRMLKDVAIKLEATFLSEMLKSAGVGEARGDFGGGAGEEQFGSFLRDAQALEMAKSGGIGLAESLFEAMKARSNERNSS
jgi:Rod binding domain-containing protein